MEIVERHSPDYERERRALLWNRRTAPRHPDSIVKARSAVEVAAAVLLATGRGARIAVRSGGHSWWCSPLRDGGMLLDVGALDSIEIDARRLLAWVGPGARTARLARALERRGLAFPLGHCPTVGAGGYLLAGGMGWNPGVWGPACLGVDEVEHVSGDGTAGRCTATDRPELLWAARGAGVGFPGIVTRIRLRLQPLPAVIAQSTYVYALDRLTSVADWATEALPMLGSEVETSLLLGCHRGSGEASLIVSATVFARSSSAARRLLRPLETAPERPAKRECCRPTSFESLYEGAVEAYPKRHRYAADQWWTDASPAAVLGTLAELASEMPSPLSHVLVATPPRREEPGEPGACFSMTATTFVACYAVWDDPAADAVNRGWLERVRARLAPMATGAYVGEADLGAFPERSRTCFRPDVWTRLERLAHEVDPAAVFHRFPARSRAAA